MFKAERPQFCANCDCPIREGDPIAKTRQGYIHTCCASGSDDR